MSTPSPAAAGLSDEDVERVARALWETAHARFTSMVATWESTSQWVREHYRALAAAALAEMRPTANRRAAEELEAAARGVMAGATEVAGLPVAVRQVLTIAATVISARAAALVPTPTGGTP